MALFKSFNDPISIRALFSCCYGGRSSARSLDKEPTDHPLVQDDVDGVMASNANGYDCDSDDEELRDATREFGRLSAGNSGHDFHTYRDPHSMDNHLDPSEGSVHPDENDYADNNQISVFGDISSDNDSEVGVEDICQCGLLEVGLRYDAKHHTLHVRVGQTRDLPPKKDGPKWSAAQVRLALLPHPKKENRKKTKIRHGENPQFEETFQLTKVAQSEMRDLALRFRLYGCERMRRNILLGESVIALSSLGSIQNSKDESFFQLRLEPRSEVKTQTHVHLKPSEEEYCGSDTGFSETASSVGGSSMSLGVSVQPELLLGLGHNGTTGRLSVEVIKGSGFKVSGLTRAPDSYVKLSLMTPDGQVICKSKTTIQRNQANPLYRENFLFPVPLFQLTDVTLVVSVYMKKSMNRREMLGWFSTGKNNSGEEELTHWQDMKELKGEPVCRWHVLLEPSS